MHRRYYESFDIARMICVCLLTLFTFGLPFARFESLRPFLGFAPCLLFTLYGYLVLRRGESYGRRLLHCFLVFLAMFVVFFCVNSVLTYLYAGSVFPYITSFDWLNFLLFNRFSGGFVGSSLWLMQSLLYAFLLIIPLRGFRKHDSSICVVLFILSFIFSECSPIFFADTESFGFAGFNFFTCTLPYLLLGRIIHDHSESLRRLPLSVGLCLFPCGLILCYVERTVLRGNGLLAKNTPLLGYILVVFALCLLCIQEPHLLKKKPVSSYCKKVYPVLFFLYDLLGGILVFLFSYLQQPALIPYVGLIVLFCVLCTPLLYYFLKREEATKSGGEQTDTVSKTH